MRMLLATVVAALGLGGAASGEGPPIPSGGEGGVRGCPMTATKCCPGELLSGCPDDYCRKPRPMIGWLTCGQENDYCRKPCPRLGMLGPCNLPNDYCRKPWPNLCRPLNTGHYTCGPAPCRPALPLQDAAK